MSSIFFSADFHINHSNIIKGNNWGFRNFLSVKDMNNIIINNCNKVMSEGDILYHIGDFNFRGGSKQIVSIEKKFIGKIIHVIGNHDPQNGVKGLTKAEITIGGFNVLLIHIPPGDILDISYDIDFVLSGHVHEKWKHIFIENIPIINVGVDVWNYSPVSTLSVLKYYNKIRR